MKHISKVIENHILRNASNNCNRTFMNLSLGGEEILTISFYKMKEILQLNVKLYATYWAFFRVFRKTQPRGLYPF